ncbi:HNH endonuclease [Halomonas organivorans]|uniref:Putative HNH nuclease YajD n=1 Tax=Halomonas organivorans TaxID=257772 RepID=A0A7W5G6I8_9GAMM|nr:HNH endonuclease signature motif containing protein [Halomonas organivorans]MBB3142205.1 5-methylcytosine-specific restriction protein A [Halomonas organivorans]
MPRRPASPCRVRLCRNLTRERHGYCEEHADHAKPWSHGRAGRGRGGRPWRRLRDQVMTRDRHLCMPCLRKGQATPAADVDHIVPEAEGGPTAAHNLEAICSPCHKAKTQDEARRARERAT